MNLFMRRLPGALLMLLCAVDAHARGAGDARQSLMHDGVERSYVVRAPVQSSAQGERLPLVLVLHGGGGNAANAESMSGFTDKAMREGFIVVYPEGSSRFNGKLLTWNAGHCCGYAMHNKVDDVGYINALIDRISRDYPVDAARIYATGMSNGGMMVHRLGIELGSRLAAIAPVVATLFGDETAPAMPVSALIFNGMQDQSVPYQGGVNRGRFANAWDGTLTQPALAQATFWAAANACAAQPTVQTATTWEHSSYQCPQGRGVELYLIKDQGHAWPGGQQGSRLGDRPSTSIDATDLMWTFFSRHSK